ncbi:hypothetical protein PMAYCL1PPCAC_22194, partial [Pristionchus mayeri]
TVTSLNCYLGHGNGTSTDISAEIICPVYSKFCYIAEESNSRFHFKTCGNPDEDTFGSCQSAGCTKTDGFVNTTTCCCEGDLCNESIAAIESSFQTKPSIVSTEAASEATTPIVATVTPPLPLNCYVGTSMFILYYELPTHAKFFLTM